MSLRSLRMITIAASLSLASAASAQSLEEEQAAAEAEEEASEEQGTGRLDDEQADAEEQAPAEETRSSTDPRELPNQDYFFLGAFYRHVVIPAGFQEPWLTGGIDGSNPGAGLSFNWRKNDLNFVANIWWANAQGEGFLHADGDPRTDTEFIDVDLGAVFISFEILWAFPITEWFAIELGLDLGLGFVYGDLVRTEAYESSPGSDDYRPCSGPGDPNDTTGTYCEAPRAPDPCYATNGAHYQCREGFWPMDPGGDVPFLVPWLALPHFALRFKPIHQIQIRIDVAYNIAAISFGGGISYGF
jgi:hypothetical protein